MRTQESTLNALIEQYNALPQKGENMVKCEKHPEDLCCECVQRQWHNTPVETRKTEIKAVNKEQGIHRTWADWTKYVQERRNRFFKKLNQTGGKNNETTSNGPQKI